jgi:hypothetical protein
MRNARLNLTTLVEIRAPENTTMHTDVLHRAAQIRMSNLNETVLVPSVSGFLVHDTETEAKAQSQRHGSATEVTMDRVIYKARTLLLEKAFQKAAAERSNLTRAYGSALESLNALQAKLSDEVQLRLDAEKRAEDVAESLVNATLQTQGYCSQLEAMTRHVISVSVCQQQLLERALLFVCVSS